MAAVEFEKVDIIFGESRKSADLPTAENKGSIINDLSGFKFETGFGMNGDTHGGEIDHSVCLIIKNGQDIVSVGCRNPEGVTNLLTLLTITGHGLKFD